MRKLRIVPILALLAFAPVACQNSQSSSTPQQSQAGALDSARKQLLAAEFAFQTALRLIQVEVRAGRLKGQKARDTERAITGAKAALDVARAAVASGSITDASVLGTAVSQVGALLEVFQIKP